MHSEARTMGELREHPKAVGELPERPAAKIEESAQ